ncbi:AAA family ATPase [Haliea salexigens]|uniref:AAA family ATPase n=1 Tax=Haliea salexigens TaxID=287487 RepID=UPI00130EA15C|nr:AAA family ATPase [Haliea salexigens]
MPRLRLIAGPNGAGKTTLLRTLVDEGVPVGQYINPDDIARHIDLSATLSRSLKKVDDNAEWPSITPTLRDYFSVFLAQTIAIGLRKDWLGYNLSLTYESVMSHASHLDFVDQAIQADFEPYLYYICTSDPDLHMGRVKQRVAQGGHDVPEDSIVTRYERSLKFLEQMARKCKRAYFFDNSGKEKLHFAEITPDGYLDIFEKQFDKAQPTWFVEHLLTKWSKEQVRLSSL